MFVVVQHSYPNNYMIQKPKEPEGYPYQFIFLHQSFFLFWSLLVEQEKKREMLSREKLSDDMFLWLGPASSTYIKS